MYVEKRAGIVGSTRRSFLKGLAALGASSALYGCGSDGEDVVYYAGGGTTKEDEIGYDGAKFIYGTSAHNCGGRCIIRAQAENGKILRFLTDESAFGYTSSGPAAIEMSSPNCTQSRACSKCRSYRFRLYHPGRLKYPMKQTKMRGDLTGFIRMNWNDALKEIAEKHKLTADRYGPDAIYNQYASGSNGIQASYYLAPYLNPLGGYVGYWGSYSSHQWQYVKNGYSGFPMNVSSTGQGYATAYQGNSYHGNCNDIGQHTKNVVMWGSNYMTTYHQYAYSTMRAIENMRSRHSQARAVFIGPEFVDQGVTVATEWIRSKPYTDPAFMLAMLYYMITNTWDKDGNPVSSPYGLDVNYLDTMVYGFFDSPEYWIDQETGLIYLSDPVADGTLAQYWVPIVRTSATGGFNNIRVKWASKVTQANRPNINVTDGDGSGDYIFDYMVGVRRVDPVPAGRSLSAYVMGSDDRLTKVKYITANNYVAKALSANDADMTRNGAKCSYPIASGASNTKYLTKKDYQTPKTPIWASAITGVPASKIEDMAKLYADESNHPIYSEWCGGQQKQADGVNNLFMLQIFLIIAKCWGKKGAGYGRGIDAAYDKVAAADALPGAVMMGGTAAKPETPTPSCTAWHNAIKTSFKNDLKNNGYTARWVPDLPEAEIGNFYMDDGGTKALVTWDRNASGKVKLIDNANGDQYYQWKGAPSAVPDTASNATYAGPRFFINVAGNIMINQHECSNDLADMWERIPAYHVASDKADALCIVNLDNYLAPMARWSDYVLPGTTTWEHDEILSIMMGSTLYIPKVSTPPGEASSTIEFIVGLMKKRDEIDPSPSGSRADVLTWGVTNKTILEKIQESYAPVAKSTTSPFYKKSWEEFLEKPYAPGVPNDTTLKLQDSPMRTDLDAYLSTANDAARGTTPFLVASAGQPEFGKAPFVNTYHAAPDMETNAVGSYGNEYYNFNMPSKAFPLDIKMAPNPSGRMQAYVPTYVWQYEWRFSKWHGWLAKDQRGQMNKDLEQDPRIFPIPMYFSYEDYHMEAYGGKLPSTVFADDPKGPLLLTTTHSRYRSHSSFAETGYLRELTHRTVKGSQNNNLGVHTIKPGAMYSGDDWGDYALSTPDSGDMKVGGGGEIPRLNKAVQRGQGNATYAEMWINTEDAIAREIEDGNLLLVKNPFGSVRVTARVTERAVKGFVALHQGCWYDPDKSTDEWVDDGGNCNTLMSQKHSRADHGNGQQSAMVSVTKIR